MARGEGGSYHCSEYKVGAWHLNPLLHFRRHRFGRVFVLEGSKRVTPQQQQRAQHEPLQRTMMSMRACLPRAAATPSPEFTLSYTLRISAWGRV